MFPSFVNVWNNEMWSKTSHCRKKTTTFHHPLSWSWSYFWLPFFPLWILGERKKEFFLTPPDCCRSAKTDQSFRSSPDLQDRSITIHRVPPIRVQVISHRSEVYSKSICYPRFWWKAISDSSLFPRQREWEVLENRSRFSGNYFHVRQRCTMENQMLAYMFCWDLLYWIKVGLQNSWVLLLWAFLVHTYRMHLNYQAKWNQAFKTPWVLM